MSEPGAPREHGQKPSPLSQALFGPGTISIGAFLIAVLSGIATTIAVNIVDAISQHAISELRPSALTNVLVSGLLCLLLGIPALSDRPAQSSTRGAKLPSFSRSHFSGSFSST